MSTTTASDTTKRSWRWLFVIALVVLVLDQWTKFLAVQHLTTAFEEANAVTLSERVHAFLTVQHPHTQPWTIVIEPFWTHRYAENPGAAWSLGAGWPEWLRKPFFALMPAVAMVLIALFYRRLPASQRISAFALPLLLGGAAGNYFDRIARGYVVDFIDWHWNDPTWARPDLHFPTFNIADVGVTVAVSLMILEGLIAWVRERRQAAAPKPI